MFYMSYAIYLTGLNVTTSQKLYTNTSQPWIDQFELLGWFILSFYKNPNWLQGMCINKYWTLYDGTAA